MRTMISTYGTQGVDSKFRSDAAKKFYSNLLARDLIGDNNQPVGTPNLMPVEQAYLKQAFGKSPDASSTAAILNDLRPWWAQ